MFDNLLDQMEKFSEFTDGELELLFDLLKPAPNEYHSLWYSLWLGCVNQINIRTAEKEGNKME